VPKKYEEYRITYALEARGEDDDDFEEVGFGSSCSWDTLKECEHDIGSQIDNYGWEYTEGVHPEPEELEVHG